MASLIAVAEPSARGPLWQRWRARPTRALDGDFPEIFIERQQDPAIRFRDIQERSIACTWQVRACPLHIVTGLPQCLNARQRQVLVGEQAHQTGSG